LRGIGSRGAAVDDELAGGGVLRTDGIRPDGRGGGSVRLGRDGSVLSSASGGAVPESEGTRVTKTSHDHFTPNPTRSAPE
jgi:hypothetical protein